MSDDKVFGHGEEKITSKKDVNTHPRETYWHSEDKNNPVLDYNETFKSAFDFSGIGMALLSPSGRILDVNTAVSNFTGYTKTELLQMSFLDLGHPDDNHTDETLLNRMLTRLLNYYSLEKRYISKYNKLLWGLHTVSKVLNSDGTLKFYVLQIVDITRRRELTDDVNRKNNELEAAQIGLVNKLTQMEELNHIIAHNLRGPANNIRMLVNMLIDSGKAEEETGLVLEMKEIVEYLDEGSNSLLSSLNTLMEVVQLSLNKSIPYDDCDVSKIINEILSQLNNTVHEKKVVVKLDLKLIFIKFPKVFLESILYNLISNALKYTSRDRRPEIVIRTYAENNKVMISVKDNGLGIDLHKYGKKIFKLNQVFHPGHDSKGIGLFITKAQIESFGGKIHVESEEDRGAEFIVSL